MSAALTEFLGFLAFAMRVLAICLALWLTVVLIGNAYVDHLRERVAAARVAECQALADRLGAPREGCR